MATSGDARWARSDERTDAPLETSRILIVDDVDANLFALEVALAPLGRSVAKARSGREALALILRDEFAVVLLDVQMPDMDGYETARWIRSTQRTRNVPIIFLTAHDHDGEAVKCAYKLGGVDFLLKPVDTEILCAKTRVFIALHERTQELARLQARRLLDEQREEFLKREVAAEHHAKAQLTHLNEQLALADRRKTEFLATLAHELRNPLAPIRSCLDVLRETPDAIPPAKVIDVLDRQVTRVTRLVDDMLDMSRIVAGKLALRPELLDMRTVVDQALVECQRGLAERRHSVAVHGAEAKVLVHGDPLRLVQVVVNLLTNAARYTPPGGALDVAWGARDGAGYLRVSDNGIGIDPERIDSLFEMFVQEGVAGQQGGLGLGLPLAKRLIEMHGGTIRAWSDGRDRGSTFEVTFPLASETATQALLVTPTGHDPQRDPRRVLVVDDDEDARELLASVLELQGHLVVTAQDGPSALAVLGAGLHDVALVDIGLPGFDGIELVRLLRERCPGLATKLVALTGYTHESARTRGAMSGFDAYLVKPTTSADVLAVIERLCAQCLGGLDGIGRLDE